MTLTPPAVRDIAGARVLAVLGDSVTTDHISPAGSIAPWSPAGQWLQEHGVGPLEFNSYGARRGHHEVLVRGTFGNIRLRNRLVEGKEGPYTVHLPDGDEGFIYDVAMRYQADGVPLAILAGREYGSGSSRDWAAKGPALLGVRFVLAESYERIHRSNLVGMGILPLQFRPGETAASLGPDRSRDLRRDRARGRADPAPDGRGHAPSATRRPAATAAPAGSRRSPGSTARSTSSTTARAGSCRPSCAAWRPRPDRPSGAPRTTKKPPGEDRGLHSRRSMLAVARVTDDPDRA